MNRILKFTILFLTLLLALGLSSVLSRYAAAEPSPLIDEARIYAAAQGITEKEALRRFELQKAAGDLNADLITNEYAIFAGLYIQHKPDFKIIVSLTREAPEVLQRYLPDSLRGITEMRVVPNSLSKLQTDQKQVLAGILKLGIQADSSIDITKNLVEVNVPDVQQIATSSGLDRLFLPDTVKICPVKSLIKPTAKLYGGLTLDGLNGACTAGFAVVDANGKRGITTCGHTDTLLFYLHYGIPYWLPCRESRKDNSFDVQWHAGGGLPIVNQIETGLNGLRNITGSVPHLHQVVGSFVGKFGKTTGYTAGYISRTDVSLAYVKDSQPTFIQVAADSEYPSLCDVGDSGGPWFLGNDAYGSTCARDNAGNAYYMAIDYISGIDVELLTEP